MPLNDGFSYHEQLGPEAAGATVLDYLARRYRHSERATWAERIERGEVLLDGKRADGDLWLSPGQSLVWNRPPWTEEDTPRSYEVVHLDEAVLAVDKPRGLPTMHGGGFLRNTLLSVVRETYPEAIALHRLGRGTSGLVLFARTPAVASALSKDWRAHAVRKTYLALAGGVAASDEYDIRAPIGPVPHPVLGTVHAARHDGKPAHSLARTLHRHAASTVFEVDIRTGRPHQIRIHLAFAGHPLVGDPLYASGGVPLEHMPALPGESGYVLHAARLEFSHPLTGQRTELSAPPPEEVRIG